jgi:hypothetical protein
MAISIATSEEKLAFLRSEETLANSKIMLANY